MSQFGLGEEVAQAANTGGGHYMEFTNAWGQGVSRARHYGYPWKWVGLGVSLGSWVE